MKKLIALLPVAILFSLASCKKENSFFEKSQNSQTQKLSRPNPDKKDDCKCNLQIEVTQIRNDMPYAHVYINWKKDKKVSVNVKTDARDNYGNFINITTPGNIGSYNDTLKFVSTVTVTVFNKGDTCTQKVFHFLAPVID